MVLPENVRRLVRFGSVGVLVMLAFMALNGLLGRWLPAQAAFLVAYPPALALHFLLNKLWTFGDRRETTGRHLAEYLHAVVLTFLIQWPVFTLAQGQLGAPGWLAAGLANGVQMTASFLLLRNRVFGEQAGPDATRQSWHRLFALLTVLGLVAVLVWTTFSGWVPPALGGRQFDYYNLLVDGFRKGSAALDVEVPAALRDAANPWNPAERPAGVTVLHDASFYQGRYYLYFGVAPVMVLFLPFRLLLGSGLPLATAELAFAVGALLVAAWLWLRLMRDNFPAAGAVLKLGGLLVLGLAGGQLALARRASLWEMPIAAGQFWMTVMLAASYLALRARRPAGWLALAGLALGLAVGSRPTLVTAGGGLAVLALATGWRWEGCSADWRGRAAGAFRAALSAGLPLALVVAALLFYNLLRFGNPLEFGLNYQLTSSYEAKAKHFSLSFVPFNTEMYFWSSPQWGRYFPYVHPVAPPTRPEGYYGYEYVYGALVICPVIWLAGFMPGWLLRGGAWRRPAIAGLAAVLLAVAGGTTALLLCFNTAAARYVADFLPWFIWLAMLGAVLIECHLATRRVWRRVWRTTFAAAAAFSGIVAFCAGAELHGVFEFLNPSAYRSVSYLFNLPAAAWERFADDAPGFIEMDVTFPEHPSGSYEPLVVTGVEYQSDFFFVFYKSGRLVQLGYASAGVASRLGTEVAVEPGRTYHLRLEGGSLLPPAAHPQFDTWNEGEIAAVKRWAKISLDGQVLFEEQVPAHESSPGATEIGRSTRTQTFGRRFGGTISNVRRTPPGRIMASEMGGGDLEMIFSFPPAGTDWPQPLLVVGRSGQSDAVSLRRSSPDSFRLGYESWGAGFSESRNFPVPAAGPVKMRIRLGSMLEMDPASPLRALQEGIVLWMNDTPLWWQKRIGSLLEPTPPYSIGVNNIGSTAMTDYFGGRLLAWRRLPVHAPWQPGPFFGVELTVGGHGTTSDPLLATGLAGRADTLAIEWLADGKARLIYDHWGHPITASDPFAWPEGDLHRVRIETPVLARLDQDLAGVTGIGRLRVEVDGVPLWEPMVAYYPAASSTVVVGRNDAGSSVAAREFQGVIIDAVQITAGR